MKTLLLLTIFILANLNALNYKYWGSFKHNFVSSNGRVIDRFNADVTHTESLGYGMFFAVSYGDYKTFKKIHSWLHLNMQVSRTGLYGWKWGRRESGDWGMLDNNNATDGDMWIAYSLLLAYEKWNERKYLFEAKKLIKAIRRNSIVKVNGNLLLLPAQYGFDKKNYVKLNPSYTIPFIFDKFAIYDKNPVWKQLNLDSIEMFKNSAVGNLKIHPDWIKLDKKDMRYKYFQNDSIFGFDSIRTPLFLAYQYKLTKDKAIRNNLQGYLVFLKYIKKLNKLIYQIDFRHSKIRFKNPPYGFLVVYDYLYKQFGLQAPESLKLKIEQGLKNEANNYYSYSLYIFTDILK